MPEAKPPRSKEVAASGHRFSGQMEETKQERRDTAAAAGEPSPPSEQAFRALAENAPDVIVRFDQDLRRVYVNPAIERETGFPRSRFLGKTPVEIAMSQDIGEKLSVAVNRVFESGKETSLFFDCITPERENWYHARIVPEFAADGQVLTVLSITRNITAQKLAEKALAESERKYRTIVDNIPGAVYRGAGEDIVRVVYISDEIAGISGYPAADFIDDRARKYTDIIHPKDLPRWFAEYEQALQNREPYILEYRIIHADGSIRWVQGRGQGVWKNGKLVSIDGLLFDITDRKNAEEHLAFLTFHDSLTGLHNRNYFEEELRRLDVEEQLPLSIIMTDLNGLKLVNDSLGHQEGDRLLCLTAKVLTASCRQADIICRWGGDEFAILLPRTAAEAAEVIGARIKAACRRFGQESPVGISLSLGTATKVRKQDDVQTTLKEAEDKMYRHKLLESQSARSALIASLQESLESKTKETRAHTERLRRNALSVGKAFGLSPSDLDRLVLLAAMHDVGKIAVDERLLNKRGPLTETEWQTIRKHCEVGARIARAAPDLACIADEILSHHERWDGTGYPRGLCGTEIPLLARILSIVDAYDVMTHGRPYRAPVEPAIATAELRKSAGSQFDPEMVDIFVASVLTRDVAPAD